MAIPYPSISFLYLLFCSLLVLFLCCCSIQQVHAYGAGNRTLNHTHHVLKISSLLPPKICSASMKDSRGPQGSLHVRRRYGPCSSLGQQKTAPSLRQTLLRDQLRAQSILSRDIISNRLAVDDSKARIPASSELSMGEFMVTIGLGTPKRDLSVNFDTGSDLIWIQCLPCATFCYEQHDPIFDPAESSSFSRISCDSIECSQLQSQLRSENCFSSNCGYTSAYADKSYSKGILGHETLTLTPSDLLPDIQFGCGQENSAGFSPGAGMLGLGRGKLSLVSQATRFKGLFSYCLPPPGSLAPGYLAFGDQASGSSSIKFTPLLTNSNHPSFYFLNLIGISVGGKSLPISPAVFTSTGTIIDSGTTLTYIPPSAYSNLRDAFRQSMSGYPIATSAEGLDTCYYPSDLEKAMVPAIVLHFEGGVDLNVDKSGIFFPDSRTKTVCLAFSATDSDQSSIIGNMAQQAREVVYDVAGSRIGFGSGGCSS